MSQITSSPSAPAPARAWIGHWLMAVAALHTLFAVLVFRRPLLSVLQRGVFNTVGQDALTAACVWFLLFGAVLALLALAITALERRGEHQALRRQGWGVLGLSGLGIVLMPDSGFWLALPAGIALLRRPNSANA